MSVDFRRPPSWLAHIAVLAVLVSGCGDRPTDVQREPTPVLTAQPAILDGAHDPRYPQLYFLPPMVKQPSYTGTFNATALPNLRVTICRWSGTACVGDPVATFVAGTGNDALKLDVQGESYGANWEVRAPVATGPHRLIVSLGTGMIGAADLIVVAKPQDLKNIGASDIGVVHGRAFPIRFRVENGVTPPPPPVTVATVTVEPATASVLLNGTQTFTATMRDADGNVLTGRTVTWSSSEHTIATVDNAGVAIGHAFGEATITATSEGKTGSATLSVRVPDLNVTNINVPSAIPFGGSLNVTTTVRNAGNADAASTDIRFRVLDAVTNNQVASTTVSQAAIAPLGNLDVSASFATSTDTWPSAVKVEVTTDAGATVAESNESNNTTTSVAVAITIADLVVTNVAVPTSVPRGTSFNVIATVQNNGAADAAATDIRFDVRAFRNG